jgi:short chain dehydrogenase
MVENGGGAIVNLSSIAGVLPTPLLATYSASKAYVDFFSQAIASEYASKNIVCKSVTPGMVMSAMSKARRTSATVAHPRVIAANTLNRLGRGDSSISPFLVHQVMISAMKILSGYLGQVGFFFSFFSSVLCLSLSFFSLLLCVSLSLRISLSLSLSSFGLHLHLHLHLSSSLVCGLLERSLVGFACGCSSSLRLCRGSSMMVVTRVMFTCALFCALLVDLDGEHPA